MMLRPAIKEAVFDHILLASFFLFLFFIIIHFLSHGVAFYLPSTSIIFGDNDCLLIMREVDFVMTRRWLVSTLFFYAILSAVYCCVCFLVYKGKHLSFFFFPPPPHTHTHTHTFLVLHVRFSSLFKLKQDLLRDMIRQYSLYLFMYT